jgi:Lar family restriction alleviation protein
MAEELKACPFCGGKAETVQFTRKRWTVECFADGCGAGIISQGDMQTAIAAWNTRAQLPSQGGETSAEGDRPGYDALWLWFSLSRSSYAVLPRVMMHDMPDAWQAAFARLMDEWDETWIKQPNIGARVQITDSDGKLIGTPGWLLNYRHPDRDQLDRMRATPAQQ